MINNLVEFPRPYLGPCWCIDPGTQSGICAFKSGQFTPAFYADILSDSRALESPKWLENCDNVIQKLKIYLYANEHKIPQGSPVFIEEPRFQNTHTGFKSAASQNLTKLVMMFGRAWEVCRQHQYRPIAVPIIAYKGQMQKIQVQHRVEKAIGLKITSHACDSVAIGLYMRGKLK